MHFLFNYKLSTTDMESLDKCITKALVDEFLSDETGKYVTKHAIRVRVLDKIMKFVKIDKKDLKKIHGQSYVHPDCSAAIENVIESMVLSYENRHLFHAILSGDYHESYELYKMAGILNEKSRDSLNKIFAVDGYVGSDYKLYIDHLQFKMNNLESCCFCPKEIHVRAVRKLYEQFSIDSKDVYKTISFTFNLNLEEKDDEEEEEDYEELVKRLSESYIEFIGIENIDKVKSFIEEREEISKTDV